MERLDRVFLVYAVAESTVYEDGSYAESLDPAGNRGWRFSQRRLLDVASCADNDGDIESLAESYDSAAARWSEKLYPPEDRRWSLGLRVEPIVLLVDYDTLRPARWVKYGQSQPLGDMDFDGGHEVDGKLQAILLRRSIAESSKVGAKAAPKRSL